MTRKVNSTVRLDIDRVRRKIAIHGYKYSALADSVGVSTNAIKNWLSGRTRAIYSKNAVLLAKAFDCSLDDIIITNQNHHPPPLETRPDMIGTIFDHHIKVFGLVKVHVTGSLGSQHICELRSIFKNLLKSLDAEAEEFGHCQIFAFSSLKSLLPAKQVAIAAERLRAFAKTAEDIDNRFSDHNVSFTMIIALSEGSLTTNRLSREDTSSDNLGRMLNYVDALAALPAGGGIYCDGYFHELASSVATNLVAFDQQAFTAMDLVGLRIRSKSDGRGCPVTPKHYVRRSKVAKACERHQGCQHLHLYGGEGSGKTSLLTTAEGEPASFIGDGRKIGPISGREHYHQEQPAALAPIAAYIQDLVKSGQGMAAIKRFIRHKCGHCSPVIDSILLSKLGYEPFEQRDKLYDQASIDKFCYQAMIGILQLDSRVYPVVLLVDDYDALDPFSKGFVDLLWSRLPRYPLTKLLTTGGGRFCGAKGQTQPAYSRSISLPDFTLEETRKFFQGLPAAASLDATKSLYRMTKGQPLLLAEVKHRWWRESVGATKELVYPPMSSGLAIKEGEPIEVAGYWDAQQQLLLEQLQKAKKPHQTLYFLLVKDLAPIEVEALQILSVAGFCFVSSAIIAHLEWSLSSDQKLSDVLAAIASQHRVITSAKGGYSFYHRLFHLTFHLSVSPKVERKIHLVLHSYWEAERARLVTNPPSGQGKTQQSGVVYKKLLVHARGCKLYDDYGGYAVEYFGLQLKAGLLDGLEAEVTAAVKVLTRVTITHQMRASLCQLFLLKTKIGFLTKGWTHPDILKHILNCEKYDLQGHFQPFVGLLKLYYYSERGDLSKVNELYLRMDKRALKQRLPPAYVAVLCVYGSNTFLAGNLVNGLRTLEDALESYEAIGDSNLFVEAFDLDYGVWIYGSLAILNYLAGNSTKSDEYLGKGRKLCLGQDHLATLGCFVLMESMLGVLKGEKTPVQKITKSYLRKTQALASAQATIWPFYYWSVGNEHKLVGHIATLKQAGNFLLCSFFKFMAAGIQRDKGDHQRAHQTLQNAIAFERKLGQNVVGLLVANKHFHPPSQVTRLTQPKQKTTQSKRR